MLGAAAFAGAVAAAAGGSLEAAVEFDGDAAAEAVGVVAPVDAGIPLAVVVHAAVGAADENRGLPPPLARWAVVDAFEWVERLEAAVDAVAAQTVRCFDPWAHVAVGWKQVAAVAAAGPPENRSAAAVAHALAGRRPAAVERLRELLGKPSAGRPRSRLRVAGGKLVGEAVELVVVAGGQLEVVAGGKLVVEAVGKLVVVAGGQLVVEVAGKLVEDVGELVVVAGGKLIVEAVVKLVVVDGGQLIEEAGGKLVEEAVGQLLEVVGQLVEEAGNLA